MALDAPPAAAAATAKSAAAAVKALLKWKDTQSATEKAQLLPGDDFLYLYITLKKIPPKSRTNPFKIPLLHPLLDSSSEFCLILDDRSNSNLTKEDAKKVVKSQNLPVSKLLKLSKLKTNYKPHEAKRKLCDSYDMFLVDRRIVHLLPKLLGKSFFKGKKLPLPMDLTHKNWKEQIERVSGCGLLYMKTGTCCVMKVAKVSMESEEIVENVVQAIDGVVKVVPKGWDGVRSLHLKFSDSLALPIYQALPDVKMRIEGLKNAGNGTAELVEVEEKRKKIEKKNVKKNKRGRIHEVHYMDGDALEAKDDADVNGVEERDLNLMQKVGVMEDKSKTEDKDDDDETFGRTLEKRTKGKKHKLSAADAENSGRKKERKKSKLVKQLNEGSKTKKAKRNKAEA